MVGGAVEQPPTAWVEERTGLAVGEVPPPGHGESSTTLMDTGLLPHDIIGAAAGTPRAAFRADPQRLRTACDARMVTITA